MCVCNQSSCMRMIGSLIKPIGCICPLSIQYNVEGKAYNIHKCIIYIFMYNLLYINGKESQVASQQCHSDVLHLIARCPSVFFRMNI